MSEHVINLVLLLQAYQIQIVYNGAIKTLEKRYSEILELHKRVNIFLCLFNCIIII